MIAERSQGRFQIFLLCCNLFGFAHCHLFPGCRVTLTGQVVTLFDWALHISFSTIQGLVLSEGDDRIPPSFLHSCCTEDVIIPQH